MTASAVVGPPPQGGGPVPSAPPTLEQLLILVARAERKGGLDYTEGARLRAGLHHLAGVSAGDVVPDVGIVELRRKYETARKRAWIWKRRAATAASQRTAGPSPCGDEDARDALRRVVALATRWTHIPAKRQAGTSVLAAVRNLDSE